MKQFGLLFICFLLLLTTINPVYAVTVSKPTSAMERLEALETQRDNEEMRLQMGLGLTDGLQTAYQQLASEFPSDKKMNAWIQYRLGEIEYSRDRFDEASKYFDKVKQLHATTDLDVMADLQRANMKKSLYNSKANASAADAILNQLEKEHPLHDQVKLVKAYRKVIPNISKTQFKTLKNDLLQAMDGLKFRSLAKTRSAEAPWERNAKNQFNEDLAKTKRQAAFLAAEDGDFSRAYTELSQVVQSYSGTNPYDYFTMNTTLEDLNFQKALALVASGKKTEAIAELKQFIHANSGSYLASRAQSKLDVLSPQQPVEQTNTTSNKVSTSSSNQSLECICGPAALRAALSVKGVTASLEQLTQDAGTTEKGTTMTGLIHASEQQGIRAVGLQVAKSDLATLKLPAIALLQDHYVTVTAVAADSIRMYDSQVGWVEKPKMEFESLFTGNAIVFANTDAEALQGLKGAFILTQSATDELIGKYTCSNAGGFGGIPGGVDCNQPCGNFEAMNSAADGDMDGMTTSINRVYGNLAVQTPKLLYGGSEGNHTEFQLFFNSTASDSRSSSVGSPKWTTSYSDRMVASNNNPNNLDLEAGDGSRVTYTRNIDGTYTSPPNNFDTLTKNADNTLTLTKKTKDVMKFDATGKLNSKMNRLGEGVSLTYDKQGRLNTVLDTSRAITTLSYNIDGTLAMMDADGKYQVRLAYDDSKRLIQIKYSDNQFYSFDYTSGFAITNRKGKTTKFQYYNSSGQIVSRTNPNGLTQTINAANAAGGSITNYATGVKSFTWDNRQILTGMTDVLGNRTTLNYNPDNKVDVITDPLGNKTKYFYDARGNRTTVVDALGNKTSTVYNNKDQVIAVIDALGHKTSYIYDELGNVTSIVNALGNKMTYVYNTRGQVTQTKDYTGALTSYRYNGNGRLIEVTNALGKKTMYEYDSLGRRTSEIDAMGQRTDYGYDVYGHVTNIRYPDETMESMEYVGELLKNRKDQKGYLTSYEYDNLGRLTKVTDAKGAVTSYAYDAMGNQTSVTDAKGNVTTKTYDAKGRATKVTYPGGVKESYTYDVNDRLITKTEASGAVTTYTYDAIGRVLKTERK
ncbi:YD repeat-containing protein [Paenibacillus shirakamiensis]|uniref:YD repeat-containing protein n=1 Tax=Paenibacillus shirakamiensis TaxID=1265935 RepID=A0ABS4JI43_9BACL|nr:cysteine peptidase family C39 domain-containing protein [Paenibacillus shirakamiensis]MBP2001377.1 YD repeat-containing protein [Paenibacillus shirakamiensis]